MASTPPHPTKQVIEASYDRIAPAYLTWTSKKPSPRTTYITKLLALLPPSPPLPHILELGCGAGIPGTRLLAQHATVTANDISAAQLALAQANVSASGSKSAPSAAAAAAVTFIKSDMMELRFDDGALDAVVALYSLIHLPRAEQAVLMGRLRAWVRPGGWLLVNLGTRDDAGSWNESWLGERMWWSGWDEGGNRRMVEEAGWRVVEGTVLVDEEEDAGEGEAKLVPFLWILAQRGEE